MGEKRAAHPQLNLTRRSQSRLSLLRLPLLSFQPPVPSSFPELPVFPSLLEKAPAFPLRAPNHFGTQELQLTRASPSLRSLQLQAPPPALSELTRYHSNQELALSVLDPPSPLPIPGAVTR